MAHAYTPGLKVSAKSDIEKIRKLPLAGEVLVKLNDKTTATQVVAKTMLPGKIYPMNVAGELGLKAEELQATLKKAEGDTVKKGDIIAQTAGLFGMFKSDFVSPIDGTVSQISKKTGQIIFNDPPIPVEIDAFVKGDVIEVFEKEGIKVKTSGVHIQGILGLGGETYGDIFMGVDSPEKILEENDINDSMKGKIVISGAKISSKAMIKAKEVGVSGIISGGFDYQDIRDILGKDLGVAITGHEKIGLTLILTEGFGTIPMADRTFNLLKKFEGHNASINGATQIRAGVMRPEIIITHDNIDENLSDKNYAEAGIEIGDQIRVVRAPHFGKLCNIIELPVELQQVESGSWVRVLKTEIDGKEVLIPRANIEVIEK